MSERWIDSHAHLTMVAEDELEGVLDRARAAGVEGVLVPATGPDDLDLTISLAERYPDRIVAAVGLHPHDASRLDTGLKRRIEAGLERAGIVAVGEIGLDYHYMNSPREDQIRALTWQLDLALDRDLPVALHNRDSWVDLEPLLATRVGRLRGVCHSFTEGPEEVGRVAELGLVIGVSGMVTFKAADNIREMVRAVPTGRLLVETDTPYLAPVPHRGKPNEPAWVTLVGRRAASELQVAAEELAQQTRDAFQSLFEPPDGFAV
jgi:TatD DNase family protein